MPELLVSADSHLSEPPSLWTSLGAKYGSRAPHVVKDAGIRGPRGDWLVAEGLQPIWLALGNVGRFPASERAQHFGDFDFERDAPRSAFDPAARLEDMDTDGVAAEVLYPWYAARFVYMPDAELQRAAVNVSNDWMIEFCSSAPGRLIGMACISLSNVEHAVVDLHRYVKAGAHGAFVTCSPPPDMAFSTSRYEAFWSAAAEAGVPIALHALPPVETATIVAPRRRPAVIESRAMGLIEDYHLPNILCAHVIQHSLTQLILSGVLERHPRLRLVISEWGTAWLPNFLKELDYTVTSLPETLPLSLKPSEYFLRQISCTYDRGIDMSPAEAERLGDNLLWASDFPHVETSWPHSREAFERSCAELSPATRTKLGSTNARRLFAISV